MTATLTSNPGRPRVFAELHDISFQMLAADRRRADRAAASTGQPLTSWLRDAVDQALASPVDLTRFVIPQGRSCRRARARISGEVLPRLKARAHDLGVPVAAFVRFAALERLIREDGETLNQALDARGLHHRPVGTIRHQVLDSEDRQVYAGTLTEIWEWMRRTEQ